MGTEHAVETFDAYRPDGTPVEVVVRHFWEPEQPGQRSRREQFLLKHGFIVSPHSCAVAVIMAAINQGTVA